MNEMLVYKSIQLGLHKQISELRQIDRQLSSLLYYKSGFDFVGEIANGDTLLVGEGNLTFTASLIRKQRIAASKLTATTFEAESDLSPEISSMANKLIGSGVNILHDVDATKLSASLGLRSFHSIVFQFPHTGSREPVNGRNPNFVLLCNFLKSAKQHLFPDGKVLVTLVDSPHYQGAFNCEEAADKTGFKKPEIHPFNPSDFPNYTHSMTNDDESALENHSKFNTWVFRR